MTARDIEKMKLQHLYTEMLESRACGHVRCMGFTEWTGVQDGHSISLGWDWIRLDDGALVEHFDCPVRTNVMILDDKGYDLGHERSTIILQEKIRALAWQGDVAGAHVGVHEINLGSPSSFGTYVS